jgi:hypothetical protein
MSTELKKCENQARNLPLPERALLIRKLIEGLDEFEEQELEHLWVEEARRRLQGFKDGRIDAKPATEVFGDARTRLENL